MLESHENMTVSTPFGVQQSLSVTSQARLAIVARSAILLLVFTGREQTNMAAARGAPIESKKSPSVAEI